MGNYASSCLYLTNPSSKTAKLMDSNGNIRQVKVPIQAGELMVEEPGHVIAPAEVVKRRSRVVAMRAEEELVSGKVYLLVSMSRVNCKVLEKEMGLIDDVLNGKLNKKRLEKKRKRGAKIIPEMSKEGEEEEKEVSDVGLRIGNYNNKPWMPVLEPIFEEL